MCSQYRKSMEKERLQEEQALPETQHIQQTDVERHSARKLLGSDDIAYSAFPHTGQKKCTYQASMCCKSACINRTGCFPQPPSKRRARSRHAAFSFFRISKPRAYGQSPSWPRIRSSWLLFPSSPSQVCRRYYVSALSKESAPLSFHTMIRR